MLKKLLYGVLLLVLALVVTVLYLIHHDTRNPYEAVEWDPGEVPEFSQVQLDFVHRFDSKASLPFLGAAVIDLDGDDTPEVVLGGGRHQPDGVFAFREGRFVDVSDDWRPEKELPDATLGMAVIDADQDGRSDLFVARESDVFFYRNTGSKLLGRPLKIPLNSRSQALSLSMADINKDGAVDLFVAAYLKKDQIHGQTIFNDPDYGASSLLMLNNGDNTFSDVTASAGLKYVHNTFQGVFVDLDSDSNADLVVAYDTGHVRTYRNQGDGSFRNQTNPTSDVFSYPMGVAVGDYDNDLRPDFFFSNVGSTVPDFLGRGDLRDDQLYNDRWILLRNLGEFRFEDRAAPARVADFEFSWGCVFEDFNSDGRQDLVVSENYVSLPAHWIKKSPGRFLLQRTDGTFAAAEGPAGVSNPYYGISPLVADFNHDGYLDLIYVNLAGPSRAFINQGGKRRFLKVVLPDVPSSLGASVIVETASGRKLRQDFVIGEGLCADQSHILHFGLDQESGIRRVEAHFLDGSRTVVENPPLDTLLRLKPPLESSSSDEDSSR